MTTDTKQTQILFDIDGPLAVITLAGPKKRNALGAKSREDLLAALRRAMRDELQVRAVVLTGAAGHFCAGADVSQFTRSTVARGRFNIGESAQIVREIMGGAKPVVCAVEGTAYGMGASLAAACDFVVAASDARFCPVFTRIGLVPDTAIFWTLPRRVGAARARQLLTKAPEFDGQMALDIGFASRISAPGEALQVARALARELAGLATDSVALLKPALTYACDSFEASLQAEVQAQSSLHIQAAGAATVASVPTNPLKQPFIRIERRGQIALVVLAHSPGDSMPLAARVQLLTAVMRELMEQDDSRVIVITGPGLGPRPASDCVEASAGSCAAARAQTLQCAELARALWAGSKPVVVAAEERVAGLGLSLLALADIAVASSGAELTCDFLRQGRLPAGGLMWTLAQKIGAARAREWFLGGEDISGKQAARIGLVQRLAAPGEALAVALEEAERLAALPPVTLTLLKGALVSAMDSIPNAIRQEIDLNPLVRTTADHKEAVSAFLEKRKPQFRGE